MTDARHPRLAHPDARRPRLLLPAAALAAAALLSALAMPQGAARAEDDQAKLMKDGARSFNKCKACHNLVSGPKRMGPDLKGLFGRKAGTYEGYDKYSDAMKASGIVWDDETLAAYLENPKKVVPKGSMAFAGIRKESELTALLAYLKAETAAP
ncbi:c-type cytochrome [Marinibaculum pumilum]|uniref:C-type cytochrome n=1 Tax=Marinibaculum pumilum TaxID=1766165 RepID=A0ABV7L984_9PROT